ncbi:TORTIFOLIA1-like protein 3 [Cajanus cajan]|uniref:Microtubule-associated protein TORTIFOLIA1 n=1 Tax=Cajanus cajan TaxID=3821 RepID=A0A151R900_CAJCA|nr:TORTIFOLIA1-like protein 3 [Cajanus cajan]KYP38986.1 Microtubule-associated protein TORTIFOLIA1 [Cajanus cajan]
MSSSQQNIKQRVFACLTKLSDRDTQSLAAAELESVARSLDAAAVPAFLSCMYSTDASDKPTVRKQCVQLLGFLAETHGNLLAPHVAKILGSVVRRLRDADSSVRSTCVSSVAALSRHVSKQPLGSFVKPLAEALFTEQDQNAQAGAALCLAAAIDGAPDPDPARLAKLLPRFEKLLKRDGFKAKPALLTLVGSVVAGGGASGYAPLRSLVPCLVESLSSDDWSTRKAAAEALVVVANVEREFLPEFKAECVKVFENRRFDKVKLVRDVMNQMLEAWKQIPDVSCEVSPLPKSQSSSKENASDGRYPPVSQNSCSPGSVMANLRKKSSPFSKFSPADSSSASNAKNTSASSSNKRMSSFVSRKLNHKNWDAQIAMSDSPSAAEADQGHLQERGGIVLDRSKMDKSRFSKPEMKRGLLSKSSDDKIQRYGGSKAGSRVVPYHDESQDSVPASTVTKDLHRNDKESEDLSLIRDQLHQIEKQQSSLLDLLQTFMGSSQNGMRSLETRVHGLELALDEISYDLAISSGRMTKSDAPGNTCCMLPGAEFLSSKFWRKTQTRYSMPQFSRSAGAPSLAAMNYPADRNPETKLPNHRFRPDGGFITNPLAEIHTNSRNAI